MTPAALDLFLAVLPVLLGRMLARALRAGVHAWIWVPLGLLWLVFLPNAPYLLTKWRLFFGTYDHRGVFTGVENDIDALRRAAAFIRSSLAYSAFGLLSFALALRPVAGCARERLGRAAVLLWSVPFFLVVASGVRLGMEVRLHTTDLLRSPGRVLDALGTLPAPFTFQLAVALFAGYVVTDIWLEGAETRLTRWRRARQPSTPG